MIEKSFIDILVKKLSFVKQIENQKGVSTGAVQRDVERQMRQVSRSEKGNIISGEGVTKSGIES